MLWDSSGRWSAQYVKAPKTKETKKFFYNFLSSEFKFKFHFDDAILFGEASWTGRDRRGAAVQESKNLGTRWIREDAFNSDPWLRGEMEKGLAASRVLHK